MYDDLARSQRPSPLEWVVVNMLLPSMLVTFAIQSRADLHTKSGGPPDDPIVCILPVMGIWEERHLGPIPDLFPVLLKMAQPVYPDRDARSGAKPRVFLRALVDPSGRISPSSIVIVQSPDSRLDAPARRALAAALFRPARLDGHAIAAWITIAVDFQLRGE
jgi:TonB family protein